MCDVNVLRSVFCESVIITINLQELWVHSGFVKLLKIRTTTGTYQPICLSGLLSLTIFVLHQSNVIAKYNISMTFYNRLYGKLKSYFDSALQLFGF